MKDLRFFVITNSKRDLLKKLYQAENLEWDLNVESIKIFEDDLLQMRLRLIMLLVLTDILPR